MTISPHKKSSIWAGVNLLVFFIMLAINYLGASGFFNNMSQADISHKYTTLLTPSSFAFSIWGVIYTLVFATLAYLFLKRRERPVAQFIQLISGLFILSSLFNMGWIIIFSYEKIGLSTLVILGLLVSLMAILHRIYKVKAQISSPSTATPSMLTTLAGTAFTLYASWVFIATILNTALFTVQQGWDGFGISSSIWAIIVLLMAIIFITIYTLKYRNAIFPIAPAWAYFGIYSAYNAYDAYGNGTLNPSVNPNMASIIQMVLMFGIAVFIGLIGYTFYRNKFSIFPSIGK